VADVFLDPAQVFGLNIQTLTDTNKAETQNTAFLCVVVFEHLHMDDFQMHVP